MDYQKPRLRDYKLASLAVITMITTPDSLNRRGLRGMRIKPSYYVLQHDLFIFSRLVVQLVIIAFVRLVSLVDRVKLVEIGFGGRFRRDLSQNTISLREERRREKTYFIACAVVE